MSCLAHDKRYRSALHSIINELRKENRTSPSVLRSMPKTCCTCTDEEKDSTDAVMIKDDHQIAKLKDLIERIEREKDTDIKLIFSFNRFVRLIEQTRSAAVVITPQASVAKPERMHSISASDDDDRMDTSRLRFRRTKKAPTTAKKSKPVKNGTFVFLPYKSDGKSSEENPDIYVTLARTMQRKQFIGRRGPATLLANKYGVKINMINTKTSESIAQALENAKKGFDRLVIHDKDQTLASSRSQSGEWVLIQPKQSSKRNKNLDMDKIVDDLVDRWGKSCRISKRPVEEDEEDSNYSDKKSKPDDDDSSSDSSDSESSVDISLE